jgi:hypothetical protein
MFRAILTAAIGLVASTVAAVPLTFGGFNGSTATAQDGFTVTVTQVPDNGSWNGGAGKIGAYGSSLPMFTPGQHAGTFEINRSGGLFFFNSVDLAVSLNEFFNVSITGWFNGLSVFNTGGPVVTPALPTSPSFNSLGGNSGMAIDSLFITVEWDPTISAGFTAQNIDVTALVPDSAPTLTLLAASIGGLLVAGRKYKLIA